jgi:hypothetical protein
MSNIIAQIPTISSDDLSKLFTNAYRKLANGSHDKAQSVIEAIDKEWNRRRGPCLGGATLSTSPKEGMLAALGYHVGEKGEKTPIRRKILAHVVEGKLPLVSSPAYTAEWGAPYTTQRCRKLVNFLQSQITNPAFADRAKAVIEWTEDLEWVLQNYGHLDGRTFIQVEV